MKNQLYILLLSLTIFVFGVNNVHARLSMNIDYNDVFENWKNSTNGGNNNGGNNNGGSNNGGNNNGGNNNGGNNNGGSNNGGNNNGGSNNGGSNNGGSNNGGSNNGNINSPSTNVNITLNDVISIDPGSVASNGVVNFSYTNTEDYTTTKNIIVENSLIITSSNNFDVKVKAEGENFINGSHVIPINVLEVKGINGSMTGTFNSIILTTDDQVLVGNSILGAQKTLDIQYSISAENAQTVLLGKDSGVYTQTVTYTATAY